METNRRRVPQTTELVSLGSALLLVLLVGVFSYRAWAAYRQSSDQAATTRQVVRETNALLASLRDAETGQRGFLLTGEDRYLEPYRQALTAVPPALDALAGLEAARRRPDQTQRVARLRPLVAAKLDELAQTIALRRGGHLDAALTIVRTDRGRVIMDQIRVLCSEIQTTSYSLSSQQSEEARTSANQAALIAVIGSGAILGFLVFATVTIEKGTRRRLKLIQALQDSQDRVRESRDWLQTTLASIGDAVITTDGDGKITLLNAVAEQLTGWRNEEAAGKPIDRLFVIRNENTGLEVENPVGRVLREGRIVGLANHTELIAKDGRHVAIDDSAAPIRDATGKIGGVVLVFRDITERRRAEKQLDRQAAELRRRTQLMEPAACFVRDLDDKVVYWNPGAADLYGFSADEAVGQVSHSLLQTQFPAPLAEILTQVMTAGVWDGELLHTRRDGRKLTVASRWALHRDADGRPSAILEVNADISGRKEAEQSLQIANAALTRANEDLSYFAFAASHDLQEPLRMITSYSQLLLKQHGSRLDNDAAACIAFIIEGNERMRRLLTDLLAYTRIADDSQDSTDLVDLNGVFRAAMRNCEAAIAETGAAITCDRLPAVPGHEPHFVQLFQNLISNALKFRSERPPRIHVSAKYHDGEWRLGVADNGVGIAAEYFERIFLPFRRLHGRDIPGTGMGLAICKRVLERYGGRIWVESQVNQGSTFCFTLPAAKGAAAQEG